MISFRSPCCVFTTKYNLFLSEVLFKMQATVYYFLQVGSQVWNVISCCVEHLFGVLLLIFLSPLAFPLIISHAKITWQNGVSNITLYIFGTQVFYILQYPITQRRAFYAYYNLIIIYWKKKWKDKCLLFVTPIIDIQQMWPFLY